MSSAEALRAALASQYRAGLGMLRQTIENCPDELWLDEAPENAYWQVAYHTLFFTHFYLMPDEGSFVPWEQHVGDVQYPDGIPGPPLEGSDLPLVADPYSRQQAVAFAAFCDAGIETWLDAIDLDAAECGFPWYPLNKLEHQLVNLRHLQHGAAQLADRLRAAEGIGTRWMGNGRPSHSSLGMEITVRALTPDDAEAYVALRRAMLADTPEAFLASPGDDFAADVERVRENLARGAENAIYGAFGEALCGAVGVFRDEHAKAAHKAHVWGVFVAPEARGARVGRRLMEAVVEHARGLEGVTQLNLSVSSETPAARRLYESVGFRVWGTEPRFMLLDGRLIDELHMIRALDE